MNSSYIYLHIYTGPVLDIKEAPIKSTSNKYDSNLFIYTTFHLKLCIFLLIEYKNFGNITIFYVFERSLLWSSVLYSACLIKNIEK